jgi:MYXO-CTERM domain-containing protein
MNGVGQCSGAMCHSDADCRAPLTHCDLSSGPDGHCVQCLFDTDCDAPLVCDPTKKKCEECVPGAASNPQCKPELAGSQCLLDGRCGCATDADCGGATSGRVCDATTSRCVPGCRGTGGNGCPTAQVCSSMTDAIGRCDAAPTDGGTDGGASDGGDGGGDAGDGGTDVGGMDTGGTDAGADAHDASLSDDAGPRPDAMSPDTGMPADGGDDSGLTPEGLDRFIAGGGCHCATAGDHAGGWAWIGGLLGLVTMLRRRRRR